MEIEVAKNAGFCFGVTNAVNTAEEYLFDHKSLYCLGDIVHNDKEEERLSKMGLIQITYDQFLTLKDCTVLIRAHGEPPETYQIAEKNNIQLIDATCPVVLTLQKKIKKMFLSNPERQVLIAGKKGHAEVIGLLGQTNQNGIVISKKEDLDLIDFSKPSVMYTQTTFDVDFFMLLVNEIQRRYDEKGLGNIFTYYDTTCKQVCYRKKQIEKFVEKYDMIVFVSGVKSSNGLQLFNKCKQINPNSHFISNLESVELLPYNEAKSIGICGATSTPKWLMEQVKQKLIELSQK